MSGAPAGAPRAAPAPVVPEKAEIDGLKAEEAAVARALLEIDPNLPDAHFLMGKVHQRAGNSAEAIACWERGLKLDPRRAEPHHGLGWLAMKRGDFARAAECWRTAVALNPALPGAHYDLARAYMGLNQVQDAIAALEREIALSPQSAESHFLLGQQHFQLGDYRKAKQSYAAAIAADPNHTNAYYGLVQTAQRLGEKELVREYQQKFMALKQRDMEILKDRESSFQDLLSMRAEAAGILAEAGQIHFDRGRTAEAERLWRRSAGLDPGNIPCQLQLIALCETAGKFDEAIAVAEEVRSRRPNDPSICLMLGSLYDRSRRADAALQAERAFARATEIAPEKSWGYRDLALLYLRRNVKPAEARRCAAEAVAREPSAPNYEILSWACFANGDRAGAIDAIERAMAIDPSNEGYVEKHRKLAFPN